MSPPKPDHPKPDRPEREPPSGRGLMSPAFWIMMGMCLLFVIGGAALVFLGPALWPAR